MLLQNLPNFDVASLGYCMLRQSIVVPNEVDLLTSSYSLGGTSTSILEHRREHLTQLVFVFENRRSPHHGHELKHQHVYARGGAVEVSHNGPL